jgi:hypothetical protein
MRYEDYMTVIGYGPCVILAVVWVGIDDVEAAVTFIFNVTFIHKLKKSDPSGSPKSPRILSSITIQTKILTRFNVLTWAAP